MKNNKLAQLFERHYSELRFYIAKKFWWQSGEAEDLVQDTFHNVLRIDNLESIDNPRAYLFQTANNLALNRLRSLKKMDDRVEVSEVELFNEISPERIWMGNRNLNQLLEGLGALPEKYRKTFLLSRVENKSYREISEILGISESTVEKHIIRALKHLRDCLEGEL